MNDEGIGRVLRFIIQSLHDNRFITDDEIDFIKSKTPYKEDVEIVISFLEGMGVIRRDNGLPGYRLINARIIREVVRRINKR